MITFVGIYFSTMEIGNHITNKIKELLSLKKVTLKELQEFLGVSRAGLAKTMRLGTYQIDTLVGISKFFRVKISDLINEDVKDVISEQIIEEQAEEIRTLKRMVELLEYKLSTTEQKLATTEKLLKQRH